MFTILDYAAEALRENLAKSYSTSIYFTMHFLIACPFYFVYLGDVIYDPWVNNLNNGGQHPLLIITTHTQLISFIDYEEKNNTQDTLSLFLSSKTTLNHIT